MLAEAEKDDYDRIMKELHFEVGKKVATERLKTDEEIIKDAKESLEKLESERLRRMRGETEQHQEVAAGTSENGEEDSGEEEESEEEDEDEESGGEEEEEEGHSDLEEDNDDEEEEEVPKKKTKKDDVPKTKDKPVVNVQEMIEAAAKEIPFTFKIPETFDEMLGHFKGK